MRDLAAKGYARRPDGRGTKNSQAKLTDERVIAIRADTRKLGEIAKAYGVSESLVSMIRTHTIWRHLP
jgi:hypothetical protein